MSGNGDVGQAAQAASGMGFRCRSHFARATGQHNSGANMAREATKAVPEYDDRA